MHNYNESLDHIPSSCMVLTVHVVKGRQYSAHIQLPQSQRWSLRPTLDLESDKSRCFNHRDELSNSAVQFLKFRSVGRGLAHASYRDYVSQEVGPAILVRESST